MSGEALTAGRSATFQFLCKVGKVNHECILAFTRQRQQKISAIKPGQLCGFFLRNFAALIPVNSRSQAQSAGEFLWRTAQGREDIFIKRQGDFSH